MRKLATFVVALGALALAFITISPNSAEAGWRRWGGHWAPGVSVYAGPRCCWYGPRYGYWGGYAHGGYPYAYYPYWLKRYVRRYW